MDHQVKISVHILLKMMILSSQADHYDRKQIMNLAAFVVAI